MPFLVSGEDGELAMISMVPVCNANETWLERIGSGLCALFALARATIPPALCAPLIAMLFCCVWLFWPGMRPGDGCH